MVNLSFGQARITQGLIGDSIDGILAIKEQRRFLQGVSTCFNEEEPSEHDEEYLYASIDKVVSPCFASALETTRLTNSF